MIKLGYNERFSSQIRHFSLQIKPVIKNPRTKMYNHKLLVKSVFLLHLSIKISIFYNSLYYNYIIFRVKCAFGNSGKMRSGNVRSGKRRSIAPLKHINKKL